MKRGDKLMGWRDKFWLGGAVSYCITSLSLASFQYILSYIVLCSHLLGISYNLFYNVGQP